MRGKAAAAVVVTAKQDRGRGGIMRRIAAAVATASIFALLLSACGWGEDIRTVPGEQRNIALIVKNKDGEFWNTVKMGAEAAAKEFNVKLVFDGPTNEIDTETQVELVNKYLVYGTEGLVLAANDFVQLADSVAKADKLGVPVVTIESEVDSPKVASFIGIDNYEAGRKAAQKMQELTKDKGRFVILNFLKGSRNAERRERGIRDEWADSPDMQVLETVYCDSSAASCGQATIDILRKYGHIDGILALNSAASIGAAEQLQKLGKDGLVRLVAFDNTPEELEWLQEGVIQATVIQNPFSMGYLGVKTVVEAIDRQKVAARIDTGTKVIDAENMFWSDNQKMLFPFVQ